MYVPRKRINTGGLGQERRYYVGLAFAMMGICDDESKEACKSVFSRAASNVAELGRQRAGRHER
jgi:hypothetical protein